MSRAHGARLCVEIDLLKYLQKEVIVEWGNNKRVFEVLYENIPNFCKFCHKRSHNIEDCKEKNTVDRANGLIDREANKEIPEQLKLTQKARTENKEKNESTKAWVARVFNPKMKRALWRPKKIHAKELINCTDIIITDIIDTNKEANANTLLRTQDQNDRVVVDVEKLVDINQETPDSLITEPLIEKIPDSPTEPLMEKGPDTPISQMQVPGTPTESLMAKVPNTPIMHVPVKQGIIRNISKSMGDLGEDMIRREVNKIHRRCVEPMSFSDNEDCSDRVTISKEEMKEFLEQMNKEIKRLEESKKNKPGGGSTDEISNTEFDGGGTDEISNIDQGRPNRKKKMYTPNPELQRTTRSTIRVSSSQEVPNIINE